MVFDIKTLTSIIIINGHQNKIAAVRFSWDGKKLATASIKGTVIRVFDTFSGVKLFEFVRGFQRLFFK